MRSPRARLGLFVAVLAALALAVLLLVPVDEKGLRDALDPLGAAAPLAYVPVSAVLGAAFVPGPILAGASGLLFGTATGFFVTLAATLLSSVISVATARRAGRDGVAELESARARQAEALLQRYGVGAVVVQRLLPAVPDAPFSYAFGLAGLSIRQVALGTLIGAAPRAFSYTAIGDGLGGGGSTIGLVGAGVLAATSVLGLALGALALCRTRAERR